MKYSPLVLSMMLMSLGASYGQTPQQGQTVQQQVDSMSATLSAIGASMRSMILSDQGTIAELQKQVAADQVQITDLQKQLTEAKKVAQGEAPKP